MVRRFVPPRRVWLQVTERCDGRCRHCGFDAGPAPSTPLCAEAAGRFLDDLTRVWGPPTHAALTGGEPMLEPATTLELARRLSARGLVVRLVSNAGWAREPASARRIVAALARAGVSGLWVGAGSWYDQAFPPARLEHVTEAAAAAGLHTHLNFIYLRPREPGMRGRGVPGIDPRLPEDAETRIAHARWAERCGPAGSGLVTHGWARVWERGRARGLLDALEPAVRREVRADLRRAARRDRFDVVGLHGDGTVFHGEQPLGRTRSGRFAPLLRRLGRACEGRADA
jgi:hypothetical protein